MSALSLSMARGRGRRGFSLLETLVSITLFLVGAVAIVFLFPQTLQASRDAELLTKAALLAQMKAEEIRRDDDQLRSMGAAIADPATPRSTPLSFGQEPDLSYTFSSTSILHGTEDPFVPESHSGVARVIVFRNRGGIIPVNPTAKDVIYELRFAP